MFNELALSAGATAAVIPCIITAHALYFRKMRSGSTQHSVNVRDLSGDGLMLLAIGGKGEPRQQGDHSVTTVRRQQIIMGDLHVADDVRFVGSLKVTGDLIVEGHATFEGTVVVNGHSHIIGDANFFQGLLVKADLKVDGLARFGRDQTGSWCVARKILGQIAPARAVEQEDRLTA